MRGFTLTGALGVKELADDSGYTVIKPSWDGVQQRIIEAGYESVLPPQSISFVQQGAESFSKSHVQSLWMKHIASLSGEQTSKGPTILLLGWGGGGGWVILKKYISCK